jgi:hypothetical protein
MLMAYEDLGFKIKDTTDDPRVPLYPIEKRPTAMEIIADARTQRPDLNWAIEGKNGKKVPYRVVGGRG